jgi:hypothetical protein
MTKSRGALTGELLGAKLLSNLKNKKIHVGKKAAECERRYLKDRDINECDCEQLRLDFSELRADNQHDHGQAYDDHRAGIEDPIKPEELHWVREFQKKGLGILHL